MKDFHCGCSLTTIVGQGKICLSTSLVVNDMLHVPKLFTNLESIKELRNDLSCSITFFSNLLCVSVPGYERKIGCVIKRNGLFHLEEESGISNKNTSPLSFLTETNLSNKEEVWLHHFHLGHPFIYCS